MDYSTPSKVFFIGTVKLYRSLFDSKLCGNKFCCKGANSTRKYLSEMKCNTHLPRNFEDRLTLFVALSIRCKRKLQRCTCNDALANYYCRWKIIIDNLLVNLISDHSIVISVISLHQVYVKTVVVTSEKLLS